LLEELFQLNVHEAKRIVFKAADLEPVRERELYRFAYLAGKPRLTRLAKVFKGQPLHEQLKSLLAVKHQDKFLFELAANGDMATALQALGVSSEEGPEDGEVVPLN